MAKLHRRVPRLPHRQLTLALLLALLPARALAEETTDDIAGEGDPRLVRLEGWADGLGSADENERQRAYDALTSLDADMLPAIRARLARITRRRPDERHAYDAWTRIRRGAGSTSADDEIDIAPGVLVALRTERREWMLRVAEPLLLWRSLERIGTFEACRAMYPLFAIDGNTWIWEKRGLVRRMGNHLMAAAIGARNHENRAVRGWATATMRRLGADEPGLAVQTLGHEELADVLRAYATIRMQSAMRVIVSYVDSDRRTVRRAARWAMEQYGGNAIWILRTEYHHVAGEQPPQSWGWRRVTSELYSRMDAARIAPVRRAYDEGIAARDRGDLETMRARFAEVLARTPDVENGGPMAEGYAVLAEAATNERDAAWAYRRALRLAPEHERAPRWRAELAFLDAERERRQGFVDRQTYAAVLAHDTEHAGATRVLRDLEEEESAASAGPGSWAWLVAAIFALLGGALLWTGRRGRSVPVAYESTLEAPSFAEADSTLDDFPLADSTLPG